MNPYNRNSSNANAFNPARQLISALSEHRKLLLIPMIVGTCLAVSYAVFWPKSYSARQTLAVRDDLLGQSYKPGRFDSLDSMKSAQETILEISRRPKVIRATLENLEPGNVVSDKLVEETQGRISFSAPNGAEFGKTEVIILNVKAKSRQKANAFIMALLAQTEKELKSFRTSRFESMSRELSQKAQVANNSYESAAQKLASIEKSVGADLSTLRSLSDSRNGSSNLQSSLVTLKTERRAQRKQIKSLEANIKTLQRAQNDADSLATSAELLAWHPALDRLKQGLVQAKLLLSNYLSRYKPTHPLVKAGQANVLDIQVEIKNELATAIETLKNQHTEYMSLSNDLDHQVAVIENRLTFLSSLRVEYEKLSQETLKKHDIYTTIQQNQSEIQALAAASSISLLTQVDSPQVGTNPLGPSKKMIVAGGMMGGLLFGFGLVLFIAPIDIVEQPVSMQPVPDPVRNKPSPPNLGNLHAQPGNHSGVVTDRLKPQRPEKTQPDSIRAINSAIDSIAKSTLPVETSPTNVNTANFAKTPSKLAVPEQVSTLANRPSLANKPTVTPQQTVVYVESSAHYPDSEPASATGNNQVVVKPIDLANLKKQLEGQNDKQQNQASEINSEFEKLSNSISKFYQDLPTPINIDQETSS